MSKLNPYFVTGFAEGEGSFYVGIVSRPKIKIGWEVRPSFSLSQNIREKDLIYQLKDFFGCGAIRFNRSDNTLKYEVRGLKDLRDKIIPHFDRYPLRGEKKKEFLIFKEVIEMMVKGKHLTKGGLIKIVDLCRRVRSRNKKRVEWLNRIYTLLKE